jgi:hypothetical protein
MANNQRNRGQAIVEMALLIPLVFVLLACMLQILLVIHLHMKMQHSAVMMAQTIAFGQKQILAEPAILAYYGNSLRWGIPLAHSETPPLTAWRHYKGVDTATENNCMAVSEVTCPLFANWFASVGLKPIILRAHAEFPCEPQDLGEPA